MAQKEIIKVQDLTIGFEEQVVQRNLNFQVREGEIFVILGGSGAGKSTLLKNLLGLYRPIAGKILIDNEDLSKLIDNYQDYQSFLKKIGVMYQGGALFGSMTLSENLALPLEEYTSLKAEDIFRLVKLKMGLVNLRGFEHYMPGQISGGMRKRTAIARAMALNPKILFLDEPSAGLDPITSTDLDALLLKINKILGTTLVIVSHELSSIFNIAHRVIVLDNEGQGIIGEGDPKYLADSSTHEYVHNFFNPEKRLT